MKKRFLIVLQILVWLSFFIVVKPVGADMYVPPPPCTDTERYVEANEINPNEFTKIRKIAPNTPSTNEGSGFVPFYFDPESLYYNGYCVDLHEYCSKFSCSFNDKYSALGVFSFFPLIINFVINFVLIVFIAYLSNNNAAIVFRVKSFLKIILLTILGYVADLLALFFVGYFIVNAYCSSHREVCGYMYYKMTLLSRLSLPLGAYALATLFIVVFFLVALIFYVLYSQTLFVEKRQRVLYSLLFGILSNPVWYFIIKYATL